MQELMEQQGHKKRKSCNEKGVTDDETDSPEAGHLAKYDVAGTQSIEIFLWLKDPRDLKQFGDHLWQLDAFVC